MRWASAMLAAMLLPGCLAPVARSGGAPESPVAATLRAAGDDAALSTPEFWIARLADPDAPLLDASALAAQNAAMLARDPTMHDLRALPPTLERSEVRTAIVARSARPTRPLFDAAGRALAPAQLDRLQHALALDAIPPRQAVRFGLVVQRAPLRTFPTAQRVFGADGDHDLDRFQESALFPGTPVAIVHRSRDGAWLFVLSRNYAAWTAARNVAEGPRDTVLDYAARQPARIVTAAVARTAFTPERPALSELPLDMGVRLPLAQVAPDAVVNGQNRRSAWPVELPVRRDDGSLAFATALLPAGADTAPRPLPATRAQLLRQAFKFLGERYGWGHDYNGRDCSGFVAEVFASLGVLLPRNTGDQAASPVLPHAAFGAGDDQRRRAAVAALQPGDLVYVPGHVLLVIGRERGAPYAIHDIHEGRIRGADGRVRTLHLNAVSVTPLLPLLLEDGQPMVDRITRIVRIGGTFPDQTR